MTVKDSDRGEFAKLLNLCYSATLRPLPDVDVLELWMTILAPYQIDQVRVALSQHMRESKFPPVPADVTSRLPKESDGRPEVDEAWAIALRSRDERDTVVWTQECAEAFSAATPVLELGDDVGARMAFKAAYARIVERNRAAGTPAQWFMSLGFDASLRESAAREAVRTGRMSLEHASKAVPALAAPDVVTSHAADQQLARIGQMVASIPSAIERRMQEQDAAAQADRELTDAAKRVAAQRVAEYEARA